MSRKEEDALGKARRDGRRAAAARACAARFALEGQARGRVEDLAADAGLSRPALLFYFADKGDLWAEAATVAAEEVYTVLTRRVTGEQGAAALRSLRRGLDEVARVLPDLFAVLLDAGGDAPRTSPSQQVRAGDAYGRLLVTLAQGLMGAGLLREEARKLAQLSLITLFGHHREARAQQRSGLSVGLQLPADLDYAEAQLVTLAQVRRR